jgi:hypothetical protein
MDEDRAPCPATASSRRCGSAADRLPYGTPPARRVRRGRTSRTRRAPLPDRALARRAHAGDLLEGEALEEQERDLFRRRREAPVVKLQAARDSWATRAAIAWNDFAGGDAAAPVLDVAVSAGSRLYQRAVTSLIRPAPPSPTTLLADSCPTHGHASCAGSLPNAGNGRSHKEKGR